MTNAALTVDRTVPNVGINGFGRIGMHHSSSSISQLTSRPSSTTTLPSSNRPPSSSYQSHRLVARTSHDRNPPRLDSWKMSSISGNHLRTSRSPRPPTTNSKQPYPFRPFIQGTSHSPLLTTRSQICRLGFSGSGIRHGINGEDDDKGDC